MTKTRRNARRARAPPPATVLDRLPLVSGCCRRWRAVLRPARAASLYLEEEREDANGQLTTGDDVTDDASPAARRPPLVTLGSDPAAAPSSPTKARRSSMKRAANLRLNMIRVSIAQSLKPSQPAPCAGDSSSGLGRLERLGDRHADHVQAQVGGPLHCESCHGPVTVLLP
jgi:hypothetical protein